MTFKRLCVKSSRLSRLFACDFRLCGKSCQSDPGPLSFRWIQLQSCTRCKRRTLKRASIRPHTYKHAQSLSLPVAPPISTPVLLHCSCPSFFFFVLYPPLLCFSPACCGAELELEVTAWHVIVTYNEIKKKKKRSFYHPALAGKRGGGSKKRERHFYNYLLAVSWHWDCSIFRRHDLAQRREAAFLPFPPPY